MAEEKEEEEKVVPTEQGKKVGRLTAMGRKERLEHGKGSSLSLSHSLSSSFSSLVCVCVCF